MKNWKKDRNYRKFKNPDGSFTCVIIVDGEPVKVNEDIYKEYSHSARQLEYIEHDLKCDRVLRDKNGKPVLDVDEHPVMLPELEVSLEKLLDEDWDFESPEPPLDAAVIASLELDSLHCSLNMLTVEERRLIKALFFDGMTERAYSAKTGILQQTIHARKRVILAKLKKILEK